MNLPTLSHLQFVVLECLGTQRVSGRDLRAALRTHQVLKSAPSFYQLMSRLEDAGFVEGEYESRMIGNNAVKERFYRITGDGQKAMQQTCAFYETRAPLFA